MVVFQSKLTTADHYDRVLSSIPVCTVTFPKRRPPAFRTSRRKPKESGVSVQCQYWLPQIQLLGLLFLLFSGVAMPLTRPSRDKTIKSDLTIHDIRDCQNRVL
ncbi:hypothetical protein BDZ89DRAFT_633023 [Hymenopellis radicata]|nr:hypothetical protein BDZ89DRAFT_633023 [Hymenopellis radicata]